MSKLSEFLSKRIPTILGIIFLVGGLGVGVFMVNQGAGGFFPKASPETTPKNIKITNITDTSFTVSFLTDSAVPGYVKYGTAANKLENQSADDRDQLSGSVGQFTTHHITVRSLSPSTTYFFAIGTSGRNVYTDNNQPYTITTATRIGGAPEALTAYGSVVTRASTPASDSIVYLTVEGASPLSTLVKSSGSWAIPLSTARTANLASYMETTPETEMEILVQGKDGTTTANAQTVIRNTQPVPTITLGQTHDFRTLADVDPSATDQGVTGDSTSGDSSRFSASQLNSATESSESAVAALGITFLNPSTEGEELNSTKPALQGRGPANTTLTIEVHSDEVYTGTVTTDANGNWSFTPSGNLSPGEHTVTVTYKDANGQTKTEQRTFKVLAQGTSVNPAFTSTPSATPKASASATPKASPKASPSASSSARTTKVASGSAVPKAGNVEQTYLLLLAGAAFIIAGLFVWNKGETVENARASQPNRIKDESYNDEQGI